jgi:hypothetical protein
MAMKYRAGDLFYKVNPVTLSKLRVKIVSMTATDVYYIPIDPRTNERYTRDMMEPPYRLKHKDAERLLRPISKLERYLEGMDNEDAS